MRTEQIKAAEISNLCNFILARAQVIYLDNDTCETLSSIHGRNVSSGRAFIANGHYSYSEIRISEARCSDQYQIITVARDGKTVFGCERKDVYTNPHKWRFINTDSDWQEDINYFASLLDR